MLMCIELLLLTITISSGSLLVITNLMLNSI